MARSAPSTTVQADYKDVGSELIMPSDRLRVVELALHGLAHSPNDMCDGPYAEAVARLVQDVRLDLQLAMGALRNHLQHAGWPIRLSFPTEREPGPRRRARYSVSPSFPIDDLRGREARRGIDRLKRSYGESLPLNPLLREHVGTLAALHTNVREWMGKHIAACERRIEDAIAEVTSRPTAPAVVRKVEGDRSKDHDLVPDAIARRRDLARRHAWHRDFSDVYHAGE